MSGRARQGAVGRPAAEPFVADDRGRFEASASRAVRDRFELTRSPRAEDTAARTATRGRPSEYDFFTLSTKLRAVYDSLEDWARARDIVEQRKGAKPGKFNTVRLRALLRFALRVGGAGLSEEELFFLYELLDTWDGTRLGMVVDDGHEKTLRDVFATPQSFVNAVKDEVAAAALDLGWNKVRVTEEGITYEDYFRPALDVIMSLAREPGVQLWSERTGPAPQTDRRQHPMDGDAFRLAEADVVGANRPESCVLGVHVYSDGSLLSWLGGTSARDSPCGRAEDCVYGAAWTFFEPSETSAAIWPELCRCLLFLRLFHFCSDLPRDAQRTSCTRFESSS